MIQPPENPRFAPPPESGMQRVGAVTADRPAAHVDILRHRGVRVPEDAGDLPHDDVLDLDLDGSWVEAEWFRLTKAVTFHYADPFAVVLYGQLTRDPEVARTETARVERIIGHAAGNVRRGQERGELPAWVDPELAGAAMFGAMRQVMVATMRRTPPTPPPEVATVLWRQVLASVGLDHERKPPR